jgi:hypothetical protein
MRITKEQLMRIIKEEVKKSKMIGFPDSFSGPSKRSEKVDSSIHDEVMLRHKFCSSIGRVWRSEWSEDDPAQKIHGRKAWDQQVMSALTELDEEIESVVNKVYEKLADGQFFPHE